MKKEGQIRSDQQAQPLPIQFRLMSPFENKCPILQGFTFFTFYFILRQSITICWLSTCDHSASTSLMLGLQAWTSMLAWRYDRFWGKLAVKPLCDFHSNILLNHSGICHGKTRANMYWAPQGQQMKNTESSFHVTWGCTANERQNLPWMWISGSEAQMWTCCSLRA
jgi:hypothetical protein